MIDHTKATEDLYLCSAVEVVLKLPTSFNAVRDDKTWKKQTNTPTLPAIFMVR